MVGEDLVGNLSGLVGPPPFSTMLIVAGTLLQPKKAATVGSLGATFGSIGKNLGAREKLKNIRWPYM